MNTPFVPTKFDAQKFQVEFLKTKVLGRYLTYREVATSSVDIAEREIDDGAPEGTLILVDHQTNGKGSVEGRVWLSAQGQNLLFNLIFRQRTDPFRLLLACPTAICKALRMEGVNAWIKWPNDVWVTDKKVSGLIIKSKSDANSFTQSVGIGINVNEEFVAHPDEQIRNSARSVRDFTGTTVSRERILANVLNELELILNTKSQPQVLEEFRKYEKLTGRNVFVLPKKLENPEKWIGYVEGFTEFGFMIVKQKDTNIKHTLSSEEVTIRLDQIDFGVDPDMKDQPLIKKSS